MKIIFDAFEPGAETEFELKLDTVYITIRQGSEEIVCNEFSVDDAKSLAHAILDKYLYYEK